MKTIEISPSTANVVVADHAAVAEHDLHHCLNCGTARLGGYCHTCGQRFAGGRLRIRPILADFSAQFLRLERGLLRTVWDLSIRPGATIDQYISGVRRPYMNPVGYLVLTSAVSLLTFLFLEAEFTEWFRREESINSAYAKIFTPEQNEIFTQVTMKSTQYNSYMLLLMCIPFALMLRGLFRKSGRNIAEMLVFALFTVGQVNVIDTLLIPILWAGTGSVGVLVNATYPVFFVVTGYMAFAFFSRRILSIFKAWIAFFVALFGVSVCVIMGLMMYVLAFH